MGDGRRELEVLTPLSDGNGAVEPAADVRPVSGRRTRRRWPFVAVAAVVAAVVIAVPVRNHLARTELAWLDRQWAQSLADDSERGTAERRLNAYDLVADETVVNAALSSLYREEAQRFGDFRKRLGRAVLVDPRLYTVRSDMVTALSHRATLLSAVATWYDNPKGEAPVNADNVTAGDSVRVYDELRAARTHMGRQQPPKTPRGTPFASATAALGHLSRWLDEPIGISLLSVSNNQLLRLDIDASRSTPVGGMPVEEVIARQGYLAFLSGGRIWALAPDGSGEPRPLARGVRFFAAADPKAIWAVDPDNTVVTEVDGSGHVLAGPLSVPGQPVGATSSALVVTPLDGSAIEIWDPATRRVTCRLVERGPVATGPVGYELATRGDVLVWVDASTRVRVTDAATCTDRYVIAPPDVTHAQQFGPGFGPVVAFSPDGRTLAVAGIQTSSDDGVFPLDLIDLASGQVSPVPRRAQLAIDSIAWNADGTRLFWLSGGQFGQPPEIDTWRLGDARDQPLRVLGLQLGPPLIVIP